jgi:hypothetical protein
MSLECFWFKKNEKGKDVLAPLNGLPEVWGSVNTDGKKFGFSGKAYEGLINDLTHGKYSLYGNENGIISTEDIQKISSIFFERTKYQNLSPLVRKELDIDEYRDFVTMFGAHSKAGHFIKSWY